MGQEAHAKTTKKEEKDEEVSTYTDARDMNTTCYRHGNMPVSGAHISRALLQAPHAVGISDFDSCQSTQGRYLSIFLLTVLN